MCCTGLRYVCACFVVSSSSFFELVIIFLLLVLSSDGLLMRFISARFSDNEAITNAAIYFPETYLFPSTTRHR